MARRASMSSASNAHIRWPERTRLAPCSTEASSQPCFTISTMSGESAGARALPVFMRSSDSVQVSQQAGRVDLPAPQDRSEIGIGLIEQSDQEVLDLDVVVSSKSRRASARPRGRDGRRRSGVRSVASALLGARAYIIPRDVIPVGTAAH